MTLKSDIQLIQRKTIPIPLHLQKSVCEKNKLPSEASQIKKFGKNRKQVFISLALKAVKKDINVKIAIHLKQKKTTVLNSGKGQL